MKSEIEKCKDLFESILCLCSEGPEFYLKLELMDTIIKEASKGVNHFSYPQCPLCGAAVEIEEDDNKSFKKDAAKNRRTS